MPDYGLSRTVDRPMGMQERELLVLSELVKEFRCSTILEVGMAFGSSTIAMCSALKAVGAGHVTSIDPFQYSDGSDSAYPINGAGMKCVQEAGYSTIHRLINEYDYVALPRLVAGGETFDLVLIDGYHSFDYTFLDFFYADLLLRDGGICVFHDSGYQGVFKVTQFIMGNKRYEVVGPPPERELPTLPQKAGRRLKYLLNGRNAVFRERRLRWCSVAAFKKIQSATCPELPLIDF
jgi:predicted O-methyltransferase YrrM